MTASLPEVNLAQCLPDDGHAGTLIGRAWVEGSPPGPSVVAIRSDGVFDLSAHFATMSDLLEHTDAAAQVRALPGRRVGSLDELLRNTARAQRDPLRAHLLAPCDLQVVKAAGVTFATSLVERVIEEQAGGDKARADAVRAEVLAAIGSRLAELRPGSEAARALKAVLQARGLWSQYLEVGIGPDAEVFTKAPVLAAVGTGVAIGIRADSAWNNPEPEVVLAVNSRGTVLGAALGNDVNLRDIEGRSALLLGKAKDNNASCAIGPFIRLFDDSFSLDDLRRETLQLEVTGPDGYRAARAQLDGPDQPRSARAGAPDPAARTSIRTASCSSWARCSRRSRTATNPAAASRTSRATSWPSVAPTWAC